MRTQSLAKAQTNVRKAIIKLLVAIEQPESQREESELMEEWNKLALPALIEAQDYNVYHVDEPPAELVRKVSISLAYLKRAEAKAAAEAAS